MNDLKNIEGKLEKIENKLNSIIELLSPNLTISLQSSDSFDDDLFIIREKLNNADKERVERNGLLIDFVNDLRSRYENFSLVPEKEQNHLDKLVLNSVYAIHVTENLLKLLDLYKEKFYQLISGNITRREFIITLSDFQEGKPFYWDKVMIDRHSDEPLVDIESNIYTILEKEKEKRKLKCIKDINKPTK